MQLWTSRGSHGLLCAFQASLHPGARAFTTTVALQRSGRENKLKLEKKRRREEKKAGAQPDTFFGRRPSAARLQRHAQITDDFAAVVSPLLQEVKIYAPPQSDEEVASWKKFERYILNACKAKERLNDEKQGSMLQIKRTLQNAYLQTGAPALRRELEYLLYAHDLDTKHSEPNLVQQKKIADLRYPAEWYPQARATQRTIHLHVGPTNSGKTYHALKRLEAAKSGFYAGPLRLLAQEVYQRFHTSGIPVSLVTGDDVKVSEDERPNIVSNTVEMVSLGRQYEVGVIDEIQMIADPKRGWAWTRAFLGACATELHLCGETRVVPLIRELAALTGDKLEIHRYERLNPLKVMNKSLRGDLTKLEKGDCVVSFSRLGIHALKADIEKVTGRRAAIIYGSLPAEIRTQQASLFNDPDNDYDFLVASDAIGMGLNLSCKRIVFETVVKNSAGGLKRLTVPEIKQIGGRAGRYRSAAQQNEDQQKEKNVKEKNVGLVTSLEEVDLPYIQEALKTDPPPLDTACVQPPNTIFELFAAYYPQDISLEYLIKRLWAVIKVNPLFSVRDPVQVLENAEIIDAVSGLELIDQLTFMAAPISTRDERGRQVAIAFVRCVAEHTNGRLLDISELNLEVLEEPVSASKEYLHELESLHRSVILYSWLSFRFGGIFTDRTLAGHVKEMVEERMVRALTEFSANKKLRKDASLRRQIALQKQDLEQRQLLGEEALDESQNLDAAVSGEPVEKARSEAVEAPSDEESVDDDLAAAKDYEHEPSTDATPRTDTSASEEEASLDDAPLANEESVETDSEARQNDDVESSPNDAEPNDGKSDSPT
ncbi:ATP-dependent RNA helicase SUV3 [Aspergillus undulatus]|uniref:ATP-dependent RNA helicase SUV3 n=1 Tax=Aspergillus undulatus TaxID=1810928 RepID=UPI003CCCD267